MPVIYKGDEISRQRIDMIIDQRLLVEVKATQELHKSAKRQVYNYLRATRLQVGLLLHFGPEPCFYRIVCSPCHDWPMTGFQAERTARLQASRTEGLIA